MISIQSYLRSPHPKLGQVFLGGGTGRPGQAPTNGARPSPALARPAVNTTPRPSAADNHPGRQRQLGQRWSKFNPVLTGRHTRSLRVRTKGARLRPTVVGTAILWRRRSQSTGLVGQTSRVRTGGKSPPPDHAKRASDGRTLGRRLTRLRPNSHRSHPMGLPRS